MNATLLDRLKGFQIPASTPIAPGSFVVARLRGVDFEGIIDSPDFGFSQPFDASFGKMMVRTASHLLGGDACGRFGFTEHLEMSVLFDHRSLVSIWADATDLQSYLVGMASSKMSLQVEDEALFSCKLYAFAKNDLVVAYFLWRRQEAAQVALDRYCSFLLAKDGASPESVANILEGMGPVEKEEILRQNNIEYGSLPSWQRHGTVVHLADGEKRVVVETTLPPESAYGSYIQRYLD